MTSKDDQESASTIALGQSLILERIFTFLPTNILLSTCSLVNKFWNAEARTFIRSNRKCTAWSPVASAGDPCRFFIAFAQLCEQISEKGCVNPWNSLRINRWHSYLKCDEGSTGEITGFLEMRKIQLNYLDISFDSDRFECPVHRPISALLQSNGSSLLSLHIHGMPKLPADAIEGWNPQFPRLKDVEVSSVYGAELDLPAQREFLRALLGRAPNLRRIVTDRLEALNVIPEEKYGLLTRLDFFLGRTEDKIRMIRKIADSNPTLEELNIQVANELQQQFDRMLEQLLNGCQGSVRNISLEGVFPLEQLSFPPLVNLTELRFSKPFQTSIEGLWNSIATIDYSVRMPQLREVSIHVDTIEPGEDDYIEWEGADWDWPDVDTDLLPNSSSSVRKLSLHLQVRSFNMSAFKAVFPNVTDLDITMNRTEVVEAELQPVSEIWELWPDLEELHVSGEKNFLGRNFDADFCGISDEEAEFLRAKDKEYLRAVHIVPIRPCPLTMPRLRRLRIYFTFDYDNNFERSFISKVTELVMLERMQGRDVSVKWSLDDSSWNNNYDDDDFGVFYYD